MVSYIGILVGIKQSYWHQPRDICHSDLDYKQSEVETESDQISPHESIYKKLDKIYPNV